MNTNDTIAAIATAAPGAIGIVRLSGPQSVQAVSALFHPLSGGRLEDHPPHMLVYGDLKDDEGRLIDRALATYSRAPASYTGEDTAELQCHGSLMVQSEALELLFRKGCRQALAGEFTRRAFLNGKMDLTQAEGVVDLIDAVSPEAVRHAAGQLTGALSHRVEEIYAALVDLSAHFCAALDYPDEDIDPFTAKTIEETLECQQKQLEALLATWRRGRQVKEGISCAIVGKPNAGKSSLLNALLGYERAIVTPVAGTTRDTVEELVQIGNLSLRLVDTAGLRHSDDPVEQLGVARSRAAIERAELILLLHDGTLPLDDEEHALLTECAAQAPTMLVWTKGDLGGLALPDDYAPAVSGVALSAKTGAGLPQLERAIAACFPAPPQEKYGTLLTNLRQAEAAQRALDSVTRGKEALASGFTPDAVLTDVEQAMTALGELTGRTVRDDVTDRIFERFCVGK